MLTEVTRSIHEVSEGELIQTEQTEKLACTQILDYAKTFFQDPKNQQAFQIWLKSKEERQNGNDQS